MPVLVVCKCRTSASNFLNSSSFCCRYSSISLCASDLASFSRFVRSWFLRIMLSVRYRREELGSYILWLFRRISSHSTHYQSNRHIPCCTIFWASLSAYKQYRQFPSPSRKRSRINLHRGGFECRQSSELTVGS